MIFLHAIIFIGSFAALFLSSNFLVNALTRICKFIGWKEFVVAFFIMAFATTMPNFFVGIISVLNGIPQLALSDVIGSNIADLTLILAFVAFISKAGLSVPSRTVQASSLFAIGVAVLPLILMLDGNLSRFDGVLLLGAFIFYIVWLFNKEDRFKKAYDGIPEKLSLKFFYKNIALFVLSVALLLLSAQGIVKSAVFFAGYFNFSLILIGILIVGLGTALPEISFTMQAVRKGQDWMAAGNILGSVIMTTTLVLGAVVLVSPITIIDFSPFFIARIFLLISAVSFLIFFRTGQKITKTEGVFLLFIYLAFVAAEILLN